ncbi:MAG: hypothetical protein ABWJ99_02615 [Caldimicrobium sp.]
MKKIFIFYFLFLLTFTIPLYSKDLDIGVSISDGKIRSFYFALGDFFRIPEEQIIIIKKRYPIIVEEELPVILIIVREAGVDPNVIIELRRRGYSWYDIMVRFRVYPEEIFKKYIIYGPPYGKAWGYHKKKKKIIFVDDDIIALANIKFISEYYREDPQIIIKYKEKYPRFLDVHYEIYEHKKEPKYKYHKNNKKEKEIIILEKEEKYKVKEKPKKQKD